MLRAARNAVALKKFTEAITRFERLLTAFPDDEPARREYTGLLAQTGRITDAITQYEYLLTQHPHDADLRHTLAGLWMQRKDYPKAAAQLAAVLQDNPHDVEALIWLARIHIWQHDPAKAKPIADRVLQVANREDPQVQRLLAPLLLDLNRPQEALPLFLAIQSRQPQDIEVAAQLTRVFATLDDLSNLDRELDALSKITPENVSVRLMLGDQLLDLEQPARAAYVYRQVLAVQPDQPLARLGMAKVELRDLASHRAREILLAIKPQKRDKTVAPVMAECMTQLGEYADAVAVVRQWIEQSPSDVDLWVALGDVYYVGLDHARAQAAYSRALALDPRKHRARIQLARNATAQRAYADSNMLCQALLSEDANDVEAFLLLVSNMTAVKAFDEAEALCRGRLHAGFDKRQDEQSVRLALARVLIEKGQVMEALYEYRQVLRQPGAPIEARYGVYRASRMLGHQAEAHELIDPILMTFGPQSTCRMQLADLAMADRDYPFAAELLRAVVRWEPSHVAAHIRLAESLAYQHDPPLTADAIGEFEQALALSPGNIRARLGLARALVECHQYDRGFNEYTALLTHQPENLDAWLEKARLVNRVEGYAKAWDVYCQALKTIDGERLIDATRLRGDAMETGLLCVDYNAARFPQTVLNMESEAKALKDWRNHQAICAYQSLENVDPTNEEARFELGQVYSALNGTHAAMEQYNQLLAINPDHREARIALERNELELGPQAIVGFDYFDQSGRKGLAAIARTHFYVGGRMPYGDENEYVELGYDHVILQPPGEDDDNGNGVVATVHKQLDCDWLAFATVNVEEYESLIHTRPTYDAGLTYTTQSDCRITAATFLNNVLENGESMRQDIYQIGARFEVDWFPLRWWETAAAYRIASYSDNNFENEFGIRNAFRLSLPPRQLRLLVDFDYMAYRYPTIFNANPNDLFGTVHPYFAPSGFAYTEAILEWRHWLSCDMFKGADATSYLLQYGGRIDSQSIYYNLFRASFDWDIRNWLSLMVETSMQRSPVYNNIDVMAYLTIRLGESGIGGRFCPVQSVLR